MMFARIVVGTDGSDTATEAVRRAVDLARRLEATLTVVSAHEPLAESRLPRERRQVPPDLAHAVSRREDVDATLSQATKMAGKAGVEVRTVAREGEPADAILDVAEEGQAELVVVGNRGMTGSKRFLLGSVPNKVSHHAPCSVLIVHTT